MNAAVTTRGILLAESLRIGKALEGVPLTVSKIWRAEAGDESAGQPRTWTFIEFSVADGDAKELCDVLSAAIDPRGGWYCSFQSEGENFVVFAERVFRYERGDLALRGQVEAYGRSVGVPASQLDWDE